MDVLSQILRELRVESMLQCRFEVAPGYGVRYEASGQAGFHVVTEGVLTLVLDDGTRHELQAGDFALLPHGGAHALQAGAVARLEPIAHAAARGGTGPAAGPARVGGAAGEEPAARYLCGALHFGATADHPLLSALPPVVLVRADGERPLPWLRTQLETVTCEARSGRPGGEAMIVRLAEMLFIQALRQQLGDLPPGAAGWLGALRDAALARALGAIHRRPEHPWTVAALAAEAGLSRSHFAERFAAVVGRPPLTYLAEWRMHRGRALLGEGRLRVGEVARRVGYGSEAAFSTAFRRATGGPPSAVRRRGAGEGDPGTASRVRRAG